MLPGGTTSYTCRLVVYDGSNCRSMHLYPGIRPGSKMVLSFAYWRTNLTIHLISDSLVVLCGRIFNAIRGHNPLSNQLCLISLKRLVPIACRKRKKVWQIRWPPKWNRVNRTLTHCVIYFALQCNSIIST